VAGVFKNKDLESIEASLSNFIRASIPSLIKRSALADKLASEYGIVVGSDGRLFPVAASISLRGATCSFMAHIVSYAAGRAPRHAGSTDLGGFIEINLEKVKTTDINITLGNEFAHQFLSRQGMGVQFSAFDITHFKAAQPFPELMAYLPQEIFSETRPANTTQVSELYSDSWSTKVSLADVDRIISNALYDIAIAELKNAQRSFRRETSALVDNFESNRDGYALSQTYALHSLMGCYIRDGKPEECLRQLKRFKEVGQRLAADLTDLDKIIRELDQALTQGDAPKVASIRGRWEAQIRRCRELATQWPSLLRSSSKSFVATIPDTHRELIQRSLEHYANDYLEQVKRLAK